MVEVCCNYKVNKKRGTKPLSMVNHRGFPGCDMINLALQVHLPVSNPLIHKMRVRLANSRHERVQLNLHDC